MPSILIIGSEGFIGRHLISYFLQKGFEVSGCDLADETSSGCIYSKVVRQPNMWNAVFAERSYDYCINAAGSGNVSFSVTNPLEDFHSNVTDTASLLDAIRMHQRGCRYLHISSAAVYGNPLSLPVREDADCMPLSPYGWHKWLAEQLCKEYVELFNLQIAIVRPFSIYGPGLRKQLLWDTYQKFLLNAAELELWGTGTESRDFIHIDDVTAAFHQILLQADMKADIYNLASGTETTVKDLVALLFRKLHASPVVAFNGHVREGDPLHWRADISKLNALGFKPAVPLDQGLESLAAWFQTI